MKDGWHFDRRSAGVWIEYYEAGRKLIALHLTDAQFDALEDAFLDLD